jgi:hypothetical protein
MLFKEMIAVYAEKHTKQKIKVKLSRYRHAGTKWKRSYSSYSLLTSALDGREWSVSRPGRVLPRRMDSPVPIVQDAARASVLVWTGRLEEKTFASAGDQTSIVQFVLRPPKIVQ